MNTIKKLIIASVAVLLIVLNVNHPTYAMEVKDFEETQESQAVAEVLETDNTQNGENIPDIDNTLDADNTSDTDENTFDPEYYEVYVDEQGQVYYLEREPEEIEIIDNGEIIPDENSEESSEKQGDSDKKEKAKKPSYSEKDLRLLAGLIYSEAGNQSYNGMLAVANVVLNRVKSNAYSHVNTVKEVIYDKQWAVQFSVTIKSKNTGKSALDKALEMYDTGKFPGKNPEAEKKAMDKAIKAAKAALSGENNIGDYLCFRMNKGSSSIKKKYPDYKIIGDHIFYRTK